MHDDERLIAEQRIELDPDPVEVRISTDPAEGFWRVQVAYCGGERRVSTTTVTGDDSFLWPIIRDAVNGDQPAWRHLAHWGHGAMAGRGARLRAAR